MPRSLGGTMYKPFVIMTNLRGVSYLSIYRNHQSGEVKNDSIQKNLETLSIYDAFFLFTRKPPKFPAERWKAFLLKRPKFDLQPGMVETSYGVWMPTVFVIRKP